MAFAALLNVDETLKVASLDRGVALNKVLLVEFSNVPFEGSIVDEFKSVGTRVGDWNVAFDGALDGKAVVVKFEGLLEGVNVAFVMFGAFEPGADGKKVVEK